MKNIFFIIIFSFLMVSCKDNPIILEKEKNLSSKNKPTEKIESLGLLEIKESIYNAGKIKKGKEIKHTFSFENIGVEKIIILEKKMSCNCTNLVSSSDTIQPKEITNLKITIDTKDKDLGKNEATITIKTNGKRKFYLLTIDFEVVE